MATTNNQNETNLSQSTPNNNNNLRAQDLPIGMAKGLTTATGYTVSAASNLVGGTGGAAARGTGDLVSGVTMGYGKPVGQTIGTLGDSLEAAAKGLGDGAKRLGEWK